MADKCEHACTVNSKYRSRSKGSIHKQLNRNDRPAKSWRDVTVTQPDQLEQGSAWVLVSCHTDEWSGSKWGLCADLGLRRFFSWKQIRIPAQQSTKYGTKQKQLQYNTHLRHLSSKRSGRRDQHPNKSIAKEIQFHTRNSTKARRHKTLRTFKETNLEWFQVESVEIVGEMRKE